MVAAIEAALPGVRLDHVVEGEGMAGKARALPDRDGFLREASARRELPFVFHHDDSRCVVASGREYAGILMPGGAAQWAVWISFPWSEERYLEDAVGRLGQAADAFWGEATPDAATVTIAHQHVHPGLNRPVPAGLPALCLPAKLRNAFIPSRLGWINYWSETTAHELQFPDPARDADLLRRSRAIDKAWVVRLTDEPLDLDREDHRSALRDAYERFPQIGGRE